LSEQERNDPVPQEHQTKGSEPVSDRQPAWGSQPQPWGSQPQPSGSPPPAWGSQPQPWGSQPPWGPSPWQQGPPAHGQWPPMQAGSPPPGPYPMGGPYGQPRYVAPPKPGVVPLRPLMFGEIMDGSFQTIRRNPQAMLGASLLAQAIGVIAAALLTASLLSGGESLPLWFDGRSDAEMVGLAFSFLAGILVLTLLSVFISVVLQGVMVVPVARSILNRRTGFRQMWQLARGRVGALIGLAGLLLISYIGAVAVIVVLIVVLANAMGGASAIISVPLAIALIVASVWVYVRFLVAPAAIVIEELGVLEGLRRSWRLTRNNWWRILGISLVVSVLISIIGQIVLIPLNLLSGGAATFISPHGGEEEAQATLVAVIIASTVIGALVAAVGYAFQTSVMALLYMDLRMRKDGLDLMLIRSSESGEDPDGVPGRGVTVYPAVASPGAWPGSWPQRPGGTPPMYG
jgi:MFS family permease